MAKESGNGKGRSPNGHFTGSFIAEIAKDNNEKRLKILIILADALTFSGQAGALTPEFADHFSDTFYDRLRTNLPLRFLKWPTPIWIANCSSFELQKKSVQVNLAITKKYNLAIDALARAGIKSVGEFRVAEEDKLMKIRDLDSEQVRFFQIALQVDQGI